LVCSIGNKSASPFAKLPALFPGDLPFGVKIEGREPPLSLGGTGVKAPDAVQHGCQNKDCRCRQNPRFLHWHSSKLRYGRARRDRTSMISFMNKRLFTQAALYCRRSGLEIDNTFRITQKKGLLQPPH